MSLIRLIILSLFIFTQTQANTIFNLIKIPHLEIYDIKTPNKLRYLYAKKPFTIGVDNNINCYDSKKKDLDQKYKIIQKHLNRYDQDFLKKINLKYIVLCEDLSISKINTAGIPDNIMKTLILDIKFDKNYFERVIHHEVFHIINDSFKDIFDEKIWSSFNGKEFEYAECSTCTDKLGLDTYTNTKGFFSEYSQSTASEDMAEVFSHLMIGINLNNLDPILEKKINFIKTNLLKIDQNFIL
ncbi:putative zinc-binding metallopeptidase [Candidatus Pelagibacter sp.]|nr:putative zinc-binding metallopeptidase [Candidatus Pelagibacter sp.]